VTDTALGSARSDHEAVRAIFQENAMKGCEPLGMDSIIIGENERHIYFAWDLPGRCRNGASSLRIDRLFKI